MRIRENRPNGSVLIRLFCMPPSIQTVGTGRDPSQWETFWTGYSGYWTGYSGFWTGHSGFWTGHSGCWTGRDPSLR
jgi:hypothetical protein